MRSLLALSVSAAVLLAMSLPADAAKSHHRVAGHERRPPDRGEHLERRRRTAQAASPHDDLTPGRVADILLAQEAGWHHAAGR